jgi:UDP-N-acetylmuramate dehydrogenase
MALNGEAKKWLNSHLKDCVKFDEPMAKHTSLQVGGPAEAYVEPQNLNQLVALIKWAVLKDIPYLVVGGGTNLLVTDEGIRGIVMVLKRCLNRIRETDKINDTVFVTAMAGAKLQALCRYALRRGLGGLNFALGIPGTVGGAVMMNAGTSKGEMADVLEAVEILQPTGQIERKKRKELNFAYRSLSWTGYDNSPPRCRPIMLGGSLCLYFTDPTLLKQEANRIIDERKKREPTGFPSAGCFFKNPTSDRSAGQLIEQAGLKGSRIGGAEISKKHANYIINRGKASAAEILRMMELVQRVVNNKFNILLQPEVKIVGE